MQKSPRWMVLASTVFENAVEMDPAFDDNSNTKVAYMMRSILRSLMAGHSLSEKQADAFIKNIRLRVPNHNDFQFHGPIKLTKKQRHDARNNERYQLMLEVFEKQNKQSNQIRRMVEDMVEEFRMDEETVVQFMAHIRRFDPTREVTPVTLTEVTSVTFPDKSNLKVS